MLKKVKNILNNVIQTIRYFGLISFILIPIFISLNIVLYIGINIQRDIVDTSLYASANNELNNISVFVTAKISDFHDDMLVMVNSNEVLTYLDEQNQQNENEYHQMLYRIMRSKPSFMRVETIDLNGDITFMIERQEDDSLITSHEVTDTISNEPYFSVIQTLTGNDMFVTDLFYDEDNLRLKFIKPLIDDDIIQSYITIEISAEDMLSVIINRTDEDIEFIDIGFINQHIMWHFTDDVLVMNDDRTAVDHILYDISTNDYTISKVITYTDIHHELIALEGNHLNIVVTMDYQAAVDASRYLLLRYPSIIIFLNVVLFALIAYIAVMIKNRNDDRILTNANIYLSEQSNDAVVVTDNDFKITYTNKALLNIYDYNLKELLQKNLYDVIGVNGLNPSKAIKGKREFENFSWTKTKSDIYVLKHLRIKSERAVRDKRRHYIYVYSEPRIDLDVYQKYYAKKEETLIAFTSFLKHHPFNTGKTAIAMIRIDDIDILKFATFIQMHCPYIDIIAQVKHNYLMLYANLHEKQYQRMVYDMDHLIERYRYLPSSNRDFTHSFVISRASISLDTLDKLLDSIVVALEMARVNPQLPHLIYHPSMTQQLEREKEIKKEIANGFLNDEFYIAYQLQKNLETGTYFGIEALLRWHNKKLGIITPSEFIPIIENSYYVNQLSLMVLRKVIRDLEPYDQILPKGFRVSINITAFDFKDQKIIQHLIDTITSSTISTNRFVFEITESHYIDNVDRTNRIIDVLHQHHILIAIDDFGTGYSSINSLKSINLDLVKLDRTFIKDYPNKDDGHLIKMVVNLIHSLHKVVIVEGTETQAHIDFCNENHCEYVQGFFISKPIDIKSVMKIIFKSSS